MPEGLKGFQEGHPSFISPETYKKIGEKLSSRVYLERRGKPPWNKDKKRLQIAWNKGKKMIGYDYSSCGKHPNSQKTQFKRGHTLWNHPNVIKTQIKKGMKLKKGHDGLKGEKNPKWKGGRMNWISEFIKNRDDYKCKICGLRDPEIMEVDHIKSKADFPELKYSLDNLITICPNCHRRKTNKEKTERALRKRNAKLQRDS